MPDLRAGGAGTGQPVVLIVDDEPHVRDILERSLAEDGYLVLLAGSAHEALERLGAGEVRLNLAVIDVSLRGTDGPALAAGLRRSQPDLQVLFVSGYGPQAQAQVLGDPIMVKPFNPDILARCVRELLATGHCQDCAPVKIAPR